MTTTAPPFTLDQLRIASPCPVKWSDMTGDNTTRFCSRCSLHVHDVSRMTRADAEAFLAHHATETECVRMYRRADDTVMTRDCPIGAAEAKRKRIRTAAAVGALLSVCAGALGTWAVRNPNLFAVKNPLSRFEPFRTAHETLRPVPLATTPGNPGGLTYGSAVVTFPNLGPIPLVSPKPPSAPAHIVSTRAKAPPWPIERHPRTQSTRVDSKNP